MWIKGWFKVIVPIVSVFILFLVSPSIVFAWGPTAHLEIAQEVAGEANQAAFMAGSVMPDMALARVFDPSTERQDMFHADVYLNNMKALAVTPVQISFLHGWQTHIASDPIETAYSQERLALGAPTGADVPNAGVEALLWPPIVTSITEGVTDSIKELIGAAWLRTYPTYGWYPTPEWINGSVMVFNIYLRGIGSPNNKATALLWYSDYQFYLDESVRQSMIIEELGVFRLGDANHNGSIDMGDVTKIERIIMGLDTPTLEADADQSGAIDMGDVVTVERMILSWQR